MGGTTNEFDRRTAAGADGGDEAERMGRRVTSLLERVPGYRGYRDKEDRRDADRRVRDHLAVALGNQAERVERVAHDLATRRRIMDIGPVDGFAGSIRRLIDRITTASYGYGGLFGERDVDAAALDQLRRFDEGLLAGVGELDDPLHGLEAALVADGDLQAPAREGERRVAAILARLDLRGQVVEQGKPAEESKVLAVLGGPDPATAKPPTWNLDAGEALTVLGDDFLVDARLDLAAERPLRLFRLGGGGGERWLLVPDRGDGDFALLAPTGGSVEPGPPPTIDGTPFAERSGGTGDGELVGPGGASGRRALRYAVLVGTEDPAARAVVLDWQGGERQVLVGRQTHPNDIEVFGRPTGS